MKLRCPDPEDITNGAVEYNGNYLGDSTVYSCNAGYELVVSETNVVIGQSKRASCTQIDDDHALFKPESVSFICRRKSVLYKGTPQVACCFFSKHQKPRLHEHQVPNPDSNLDHNPHGRGAWSESGFESSLLPCKCNQSGSGSGSESRLMNVKIIRP